MTRRQPTALGTLVVTLGYLAFGLAFVLQRLGPAIVGIVLLADRKSVV